MFSNFLFEDKWPIFIFSNFSKDLSCENGGSAPNLYQSSHSGPYCEVEYESYLNNWHDFRERFYSDYDNAHLLSYFDFKDSVIGYASISGMCTSDRSGGIDQVTYDDEYNGNIIAHEMVCGLIGLLYSLYTNL